MHWIWILLILLSTGSVIGYYFKKRIDSRSKERDRIKQNIFEDSKRQLDLLLEFTGLQKTDFITLHQVGGTWDEEWRRSKAEGIQKWIDLNRPYFALEVQKTLTFLSSIAGLMVKEQSMGHAQRVEIYQKVSDNFEIIEKNISELKRSLRPHHKL